MVLDTLIAGGATGIMGSFLHRLFSVIENWQQFKVRKEDRKHELELLKMHLKQRSEETENAFAVLETRAAAEVQMASYLHDMSIPTARNWVLDLIRLMRPCLTLLLLVMTLMIWLMTQPHEVLVREMIIQSILYSATSALLWWFGDRSAKSMFRHKEK